MLLIILLSITALSVIVMAGLVLRHWKEIQLLNPDSIKEERERQKRDDLLQQRFVRMTKEKVGPIKAVVLRGTTEVKKLYHAVYLKYVRLEKFYSQAKSPFAAVAPSVKDRIKLLLDEARSLARDLKWADAERRYLEVLGTDQRNVDAYKGLGMIYLKQKLYPQARETFEYLVKSKKADDIAFAALAEIEEAEGNMTAAEAMRRSAIEVRPRLANRHADLAEFYVARDQVARAWPYAKRANELDPKSAKYLELSLEVAILLGDRNEAKRRYDKLRLLSEDQPKLQALKDRIEAIA
jgi:tetratricopeptide (TPR) repeat protein